MGSVQNLKTIPSPDLISPEVSAKVEANQLTKNTEIIAKMAFANYEVLYHQDTGIPHLFKKLGPNETDDPEIAKLKQQYQIRFQPKKGGIGKELKPEYFNSKIQAKFTELVKEMQVDLKDGTLLIPEKAADGSIKKDASGKEIYHPTHLTPDALMAALVVSKKVKHTAPFVLSIEMNGRKGQENETVQLQCVVDAKGNRHLVQIIEHLATGGSNEIYKCWETYTNSISVYKHSDTEAPKNLSYEEAVNIHKAYGKKKGSVTGLQDRPHLYWQYNREGQIETGGYVGPLYPADLSAALAEPNREMATGEIVLHLAELYEGVLSLTNNSLLHGDIKPSNIFVGQDGSYKIADFDQIWDLDDPKTYRFKDGFYFNTSTDSVGNHDIDWMAAIAKKIKQTQDLIDDANTPNKKELKEELKALKHQYKEFAHAVQLRSVAYTGYRLLSKKFDPLKELPQLRYAGSRDLKPLEDDVKRYFDELDKKIKEKLPGKANKAERQAALDSSKLLRNIMINQIEFETDAPIPKAPFGSIPRTGDPGKKADAKATLVELKRIQSELK